MRTIRNWLVGISVAAVAALIGCGGTEQAVSSEASGGEGTGAAASADTAARKPAPGFTLNAVRASGDTLEATKFTLSDRLGEVTVLYFSFVG